MCRLHEARHFRGDSQFSTWLTRIALNEALGRVRRRRPSRRACRTGRRTSAQGGAVIMFPTSLTPPAADCELARRQVREFLEKAVDDLPDAFRTVFILRDIEEMSIEETAEPAVAQARNGQDAASPGAPADARGGREAALPRPFPSCSRSTERAASGWPTGSSTGCRTRARHRGPLKPRSADGYLAFGRLAAISRSAFFGDRSGRPARAEQLAADIGALDQQQQAVAQRVGIGGAHLRRHGAQSAAQLALVGFADQARRMARLPDIRRRRWSCRSRDSPASPRAGRRPTGTRRSASWGRRDVRRPPRRSAPRIRLLVYRADRRRRARPSTGSCGRGWAW